MCMYLQTCVPLYLVFDSNFSQHGSTFYNAQKEEEKMLIGKKLNVYRQFFKDVIRTF